MSERKGLLAVLLALLLGGCAQYQPAQPQWQQVMYEQHGLIYTCDQPQAPQLGPGQVVGTLGGAALGGYIGSEAGGGKAGTAGGAVLGAILGNQVGQQYDRPQPNCRYVPGPTYPHNQQIYPQQPVYRPGFGPAGMICKEFHSDHVTVVSTGEIVEANFIACQDRDGYWRIMQ